MDVKGSLGTTTNDHKRKLVALHWLLFLLAVGTSSCLRNIPKPTRQHMPNMPTQMCCPCACNKAQGSCIANCNTNVLPMHICTCSADEYVHMLRL